MLIPIINEPAFFLAQLDELGLFGIAAVFPSPPYVLSALEARAAVVGMPLLTITLLRYHWEYYSPLCVRAVVRCVVGSARISVSRQDEICV